MHYFSMVKMISFVSLWFNKPRGAVNLEIR